MLPESSLDLSPLAAVTCSHTGCPFMEYRATVLMHSAGSCIRVCALTCTSDCLHFKLVLVLFSDKLIVAQRFRSISS